MQSATLDLRGMQRWVAGLYNGDSDLSITLPCILAATGISHNNIHALELHDSCFRDQ